MDTMKPALLIGGALFALALLLAGCAKAAKQPTDAGKARSLTLFAFNYTDRGILNITVDGVWMGAADAHTQGGGAMGPRPPRDRTKPNTVEVRWEISASYYDLKTNKYVPHGELEQKSATVPITFPYPDSPNALVLHFYPDGYVEAEMIGRKDNVFDFRRIPIPEGHRSYRRP